MLFCVKTPINKLYVFGLALLLTLTLAGCGGGGGGSAAQPDPDPPVTMPDPDPEPTGPTPEEIAAMTDAAKTKAEAINAEAMQQTDAGIGGSAAVAFQYSLSISRDREATKVTITDSGMMEDDDPKFMMTKDLDESNGLAGSMHVRVNSDDENGKVEEVVGVYTDITAPEPKEFFDVHTPNVSTNTNNDSPVTTNEAIRITSDQGGQISNAGMLESPGFSASGVGTLTFKAKVDDDVSTTNVDESVDAFEAAGTFDGAPGRVKCNGDSGETCTVTLEADGKITGTNGDWVFIPDAGAMVDDPDADYLYYGFWVKKTDKDGVITYNEVQTFSGAEGVNEFPSGNMEDVVGAASYEGGSAGVYMKKTFTSEGELDTATSGTFTADVSLTAHFGGDDVAFNKQYSVEGSVSNFALSGGEENAWSVNLQAGFSNLGNDFDGTANGGGAEATWQGVFYGDAENTPADDDGALKLPPAAVAGEYNAHFSNGHVAGAFGAYRQ